MADFVEVDPENTEPQADLAGDVRALIAKYRVPVRLLARLLSEPTKPVSVAVLGKRINGIPGYRMTPELAEAIKLKLEALGTQKRATWYQPRGLSLLGRPRGKSTKAPGKEN